MEKDDLKDAKEAFQQCVDNEAEQRIISLEDLRFSKLGEQWPDGIKQERDKEDRPTLTLNRLPSFIKQVTNDARQNKPSIKCRPVGDGADQATAEIYDGLIRNIEGISNAHIAYDTALDFAVTMGFGYWIIRTDYATDDSFDQDILIEAVTNPFSIYGDPYSSCADSSDWNTAFITDMMREKEFKKRWPKADLSDFKGDGRHDKDQLWFQGDQIMVAEYWTREEVPVKLLKLTNGAIMREPEYLKMQDILKVQGVTVEGDRMTRTHKVKQRIMNGDAILETNDWLGRYIPIVPVYGDEVNVEGRRHFLSLIRFAKDAQRNYNYWRSASTELVALAPKTPFIGAVGQFDTDAAKWATANTKSHAYIEYDPVGGQPPPQRQPFAGPPAGALQEAANASDDMKNIMGLHDASLGARSNETSGKAILARQREGDVATFNFTDNLSRAISHCGRIMVDLIPKLYDVPKVIRVLKEDGTNFNVPINQPVIVQEGQPPQAVPPDMSPEQQKEIDGLIKFYDLSAGKYDLTVSTGPSFTTKREESASQMMEFIRIFPQAAPLIGDLLAKNLDWPGADEVSKRLKAMLPPQAAGQVDPIVQQLQQQLQQMDQQAKQAVGQLQQQLGDMQKALNDKTAETQIKMFEAETKRMQATNQDTPRSTVIDPLAVKQLEIDERRLEVEAFEAETARMQASAAMMPQDIDAMVSSSVERAIGPQGIENNNAVVIAALQGFQEAVKQLQAPKRVVKDDLGNIIGVETVQEAL